MRFVWRTIRFTVFFGGDLFLLNAFSAGRPVIAVVPAGARAPSPVQTTTWFTRVQSRSFASSTWFFLFLFFTYLRDSNTRRCINWAPRQWHIPRTNKVMSNEEDWANDRLTSTCVCIFQFSHGPFFWNKPDNRGIFHQRRHFSYPWT